MAFWKKKEPAEPMISKAEHDRIVAANDRIALTGRQSLHVLIKQKDEEIGYFQVENARLLAELATLKAERDAILRDKKLETARRTEAVSHTIAFTREIEALKPDALKYRERLRRDREALAAKRKRAVAAIPKAQAARGGDVREGV